MQKPSNYADSTQLLGFFYKQMTGIEPASPAWEAGVLPMNYICAKWFNEIYYTSKAVKSKGKNQRKCSKKGLPRYMMYRGDFWWFIGEFVVLGSKVGAKNTKGSCAFSGKDY